MTVPSPPPVDGGGGQPPRPTILTVALGRDQERAPSGNAAIASAAASARRWRWAAMSGSAAGWVILGVIARGDQAAYSGIVAACLLSLVIVHLVARALRRGRPAPASPVGRRMSDIYTGYMRGTLLAFCVLAIIGLVAGWWPRPTCTDCGPVIGD